MCLAIARAGNKTSFKREEVKYVLLKGLINLGDPGNSTRNALIKAAGDTQKLLEGIQGYTRGNLETNQENHMKKHQDRRYLRLLRPTHCLTTRLIRSVQGGKKGYSSRS